MGASSSNMALRVVALLALLVLASADHTVLIQPGLSMPFLSLGLGSGQQGVVANVTRLWLQAGGTGFDTAYDYQNEAQIRIGLASSNSSRDSLFVTTKIPCSNYATATKHIQSNLQQLGFKRVDLTLIHFLTPFCGASETWRALEEPPVLNQCSLSVSHHDDETIAYCKSIGIVYMAYSPLCGGHNGSSCTHGSVLRIPEVNQIAAAHNVSAAQVGLKWVVQQGHPLACATSKLKYAREDLDLWSWGNLTHDEMAKLSALNPVLN